MNERLCPITGELLPVTDPGRIVSQTAKGPWTDESIMRLYDSVCDIPNLLQEIRKLQAF